IQLRSAIAPGEDAEEGFDVGVGSYVAVAVEVGAAGAGRGWAVAGEAAEEGFDVGVGADVAIAVVVGDAAQAGDADVGGAVVEVDPADVLAPDVTGEVAASGIDGRALCAGGGAGIAPVEPAAVLGPGVLVVGGDVGLGVGEGRSRARGEKRGEFEKVGHG